MPAQFTPVHRHLEFLSPLSPERARELVRFMSTHARASVVDVGCGWAALLIQLLPARPDIRGLGLELNQDDLAHAARLADERGVSGRLDLIAGDAKLNLLSMVAGAMCIGASQIWGPPVEACEPLAYAAALCALRQLVVRGGPVVYGECIWSAEPTAAAAAPLAGRLDEFVALPDLLDLARSCGFAVVQVHEATLDEWDRFEYGYVAGYAEWLATHAQTDPDYDAVAQRARRQQEAYFRGYRGVLGMAYLCLLTT